MKRVVILTFSRSYNYGASLQAYSLQHFIRTLGMECKIIDIRTKKQINNELEYRSDLIGRLLNIFTYIHRKELSSGMARFNAFNYSSEDRTVNYGNESLPDKIDYEMLEKDSGGVDFYLSGSDQVFSPTLMSRLYFQDFNTGNAKSISYAASIGVSVIPETMKEEFTRRLRKFQYISMREESGKEVVSKLTNRSVTVNADPVFLTNMEEWVDVERKYHGLEPGKYIFAYFLYRHDTMNATLKNIHEETGYPVVLVDRGAFRGIYHQKLILDAGPQEFLWILRNSYMVVTSSFHGTAFSLIFKKDFLVFNNPKTPERITNLLELTDVQRHDITDKKVIESADWTMTDYEKCKIQHWIIKEQERAKLYLLNCFRSEKDEY